MRDYQETCPSCGSESIESTLTIDDGGGDYGDELVEAWACVCLECGETWSEPYHSPDEDDLDLT